MGYLLKHNVFFILIISFFIRIIGIIMFRDLKVDHEWGILLSNLELFGALSVHTIQGEIVDAKFLPKKGPKGTYSHA